MSLKQLNLGCGHDIKTGWINLDKAPLPGVDVVFDLEQLPLPFEANEFDTILCNDVLEHVDYLPLLKEIHRILKPSGQLKLRVPHFTSRRNYVDPTHKKQFSLLTFDFFIKNSAMNRDYYFDFHFTAITRRHLVFEKKWFLFWNPIIEILINANRKILLYFYESTFLSRLFPGDLIEVTLTK